MTLWRWDRAGARWQALALEAGEAAELPAGVRLLPLASRRCALLSPGSASANGVRALPLRILDDRDEIRVEEDTLYFSAEGPMSVVRYSGDDGVRCARCKGPMKPGEPGLRCPRCRVWHHQSEALPCWTYADTCSSCDRPTAGPGWEPEPLEPAAGVEPAVAADGRAGAS